VSFQVDIGFGDAVTPKPERAVIPSFLDFADTQLNVYPVYTVIAEKFQVMVALGLANSRIKDFCDIWVIATSLPLEGQLLADAISATFARRDTAIVDSLLTVFSDEFGQNVNKKKQWAAFVMKNSLECDLTFVELMDQLKKCLQPIYQAVLQNKKFDRQWNIASWQWLVMSKSDRNGALDV
jgi:hypothetical protein